LGQFVVRDLASEGHRVAFTVHSHPDAGNLAKQAGSSVSGHTVDLQTGEGLDECVASLGGPVEVIVNCAAISQPGVVQKDINAARKINVPTAILNCTALKSQKTQPLLIHLSTDQVYQGTKACSSEEDEPNPVNGYGQTKLEAERAIAEKWEHHVILRSSIIYGSAPPLASVARALFLQWMDSALAGTEKVSFFNDEFRNPIFVQDILKIVRILIAKKDEAMPFRVFNMGGPERLSRVDMAMALAKVKHYDTSNIVSASSATVDRGVKSPPDISMDVSRIQSVLGIQLMCFEDAVAGFM